MLRRSLSTAVEPSTKLAVLSWGSGHLGVLGNGNEHGDVFEPAPLPALDNLDIVKIGCGHYSSFAITSQGQLYSWGRNKEFQLGRLLDRNEGDVCSAVPRAVATSDNKSFASITGSGVATFAISTSGELYVCGSSKRGQLGLGNDTLQSQKLQRISTLPGKVVSVSCGWGHAAAVIDDGSLYTWGWPANGRLGHSFASSVEEENEEQLYKRCVYSPKKVDVLQGVKLTQVACGMDHTLAMAQDGTCFSFGDSSLGQLGRPIRQNGEHLQPKDAKDWLIEAKNIHGKPTKFRRVTAGLGHNLGILSDGNFVAWGWNNARQCGVSSDDDNQDIVSLPTVLYGVPECREGLLAAGRVHSAIVTDEMTDRPSTFSYLGRSWAHLSMAHVFGAAENGRLGLGIPEDAPFPELLTQISDTGELVLDIACGYDHTLILLVV